MCLRNCDLVGMAGFAPTVNTRGCIYTYDKGIVLRSTYYVFDLYVHYLGDIVLNTWEKNAGLQSEERGWRSAEDYNDIGRNHIGIREKNWAALRTGFVIMYLFLQRYFVKGAVDSAVKGKQ